MSESTYPPGGLLRLDAARPPDDSGILLRVRSAAGLGPSLTPFTILDWGPPEGDGQPSWGDFEHPVLAIGGNDPITGTDQTGYRSTRSESPYEVAGGPLVAGGPDVQRSYRAFQSWQSNPTVLTSIAAEILPTGPWRATSSAEEQDLGAVSQVLQAFGHPWSADDPVDRARTQLDPWLEDLQTLLGDPGLMPLATATLGEPDRLQIELGAWLAAMQADPAAAALLGTFTSIRPDFEPSRVPRLLAVVGAFAVPSEPKYRLPAHELAWDWRDGHPQSHPKARALLDGLHEGLADVESGLGGSHEVCVVWAPAVLVPLPDLPQAPVLAPAPGSTRYDDSWRGGVVVPAHLGGPVALERSDGDRELRDVVLLPPNGEVVDEGWTSFQAASYRAWVQDPWGQWSAATTLDVQPPSPALPGPPQVRLEFEPAPAVAGRGPVSPGRVRIRAFTGTPPVGGYVVDPVTAVLTGTTSGATQLSEHGEWWHRDVDVVPTTPGERRLVTATVTAHTGGGDVEADQVGIWVVDPRHVEVPARGPALLFSGPRRPDGSAEVDLVVPVPAGTPPSATFRVYAADESALRPGLIPPPTEQRCRRVAQLRTITRRDLYVLLPESSVTADPRGVRIRAVLPGRSSALRVLQLVPVTSSGVEAPAGRCDAFVVAAPLDDAPGTPGLDVRRAAAPRTLEATVTITVPRDATVPLPLARRGLGATAPLVAQVLWAPVAASLAEASVAATVGLAADHPAAEAGLWRWTGTATLPLRPAVPAYAALRLWARVAWPPEPALPAGVQPEAADVKRYWGDLAAQPGEWGPASAAVPAMAAEPPGGVTCRTVPGHPAGGTRLEVTLPVVEPLAPTWSAWQFSLRTVGQSPSQGAAIGPTLTIDVPVAWQDPLTWRLSITAPDGSAGPVFNGLGATP